jgi:uncharacterized phiE125 gp8 family phage protein
MSFTVSTQPSVEPVSVAEAKSHLRVTASDDDAYIGNLIKAARQRAEGFTKRAIVTQTIQHKRNGFDTEIVLPMPPVQSITSVQYVDDDGNTQSFTDFQTDLTNNARAVIKPAYDASWPSVRDQFSSVTITYVAGFGGGDSPDTISNVPEDIRQAILLMVGTMYEYREDNIAGVMVSEIPVPAMDLLRPYRVAIV